MPSSSNATDAASSLSLSLNNFLEEADIEKGTTDGPFRKFLVKSDLVDVPKFGSFCSEENLLDSNFIQPAVTAGPDLGTLGKKGAVRWLWRLCRQSLERGDQNGASRVDDGKPIGPTR